LQIAPHVRCATDEITGAEEQTLIDSYRLRLIKIAAVALAATESLDRIMEKRAGSSNKDAALAQRSAQRTNRRLKK
jgi:hypothetical protein